MTAIPADPVGARETAPAAIEPMTPVKGRLSALSLLTFSGPAFPLAALALPLVVYLPHFYAAQMGISLTAVGAIFSIVRLLDIGFDPVLGAVMDRTHTRFGRFKPWMVASIPILIVSSWMVFMPPKGATAPYLIASLVLMYLGYSMAVLGHLAWGGTLASNYHERSRIFGWVQAGTVGGLILVMILPVILAKVAKNGDAAGVASMGWFVMILTPIAIALAVWRIREPVNASATAGKAGLGAYLRVIRRPAVMRIVAATVLLATAPGITGAIFLFFFRQARGFSAAETNLLLLVYFVGGFAGAPLWAKLAKRIGKHRGLMVSCGYYIVMQGLFLLTPKGSMALTLPVILLAGLGFSAYLVLLRAMTADACDEARLDLDRDCTGMIFALHNAGTKIGSALGVAITFPLLQQVFGFVAKDSFVNTPYALQGLQFAFIALPMVSVILGGLTLWGYKLTEARHDAVRQGLELRDAG
jgi:GPH family glycoside/pentoside/hexuronide:cation symporter